MIYLLEDTGSLRIKIGKSLKPKKRLPGIQTAVASKLVLLGGIQGLAKVEKHLHKHFAEHREQGEWFSAAVKPHALELVAFPKPQRPPVPIEWSRSYITYRNAVVEVFVNNNGALQIYKGKINYRDNDWLVMEPSKRKWAQVHRALRVAPLPGHNGTVKTIWLPFEHFLSHEEYEAGMHGTQHRKWSAAGRAQPHYEVAAEPPNNQVVRWAGSSLRIHQASVLRIQHIIIPWPEGGMSEAAYQVRLKEQKAFTATLERERWQ